MKYFSKITRSTVTVLSLLVMMAGASVMSASSAVAKTLTAGTASGNLGADVIIPITIDDPSEIGGIAFTLTYNPAVFEFKGLEQVTPGWTVNDGSAYQVPNPAAGDPTYYNPYNKEAPYDTVDYTLTGTSTLFYQYNDKLTATGQHAGMVLVSGATATPLTGTALFNARFNIKQSGTAINGATYPIRLFRSVIGPSSTDPETAAAAGYTVDTFLPVLVGTGTAGPDGKYASLDFPVIPVLLVDGNITVTAPVYALGGKATYGSDTGANATGSTVTLQRLTATGLYAFNDQTTVGANGLYNFAGKSAGNYKVFVTPLDTTYQNYESQAIALAANKTDANVILQSKPTPERIFGAVTAGNAGVGGLRAKVVDSSGKVMGIYEVAANGTWTSDLLPPGTYQWYLVYGSLEIGPYEEGESTVFDTAQLKSISGTIANMPGSGAVTVGSVMGKMTKTIQAANGSYTVDNLVPANDYLVSLVATGLPVTYYNMKTDVTLASKVDVSQANASGIDFTFTPPNSYITGTISDAGGTVSGKTIYGFEVNTFGLVQTTVGADGSYDLRVDPGSYEVFVIKANGKIFYFYNEDGTATQRESGATLRTLTAGQTAENTNINITEADKTLAGKVTYRTSTGDPAVGVLIVVFNDTQKAVALTDEKGAYTVGGLINGMTYTVEMKPLTGNYAVQTATIVAGTNTTKNFIIDTGAVLSGTIKDLSTSDPVGGAMLFLKDQTTGALVGGRVYFSGTDGAYAIRDIQSGSYTLEVTHPDYLSYTVDLVIGSADVTQNVTLQKGAYFKGTISDNSNPPLPLNGVSIIVTRSGITPIYTVTNSSGYYSVYGLDQNQSDYMIFAQKRGYERQVALFKQPSTSGTTVDLTLSPPVQLYKISGTVNKSDGLAVEGAIVVVSSKSKNFFANTTTDAAGAYSISGMVDSSDYKIVVIPGGNLPTQTDNFSVSGSDVTKNFTIQLGNDIGGTISGPPTNAKVYVFLYKASTYVTFARAEGNGSFLFKGLTAGNDYKVLVVSPGYTMQWYSGKSGIDTADTIVSGTTDLAITLTAAQ